jgi:hypothetical protein
MLATYTPMFFYTSYLWGNTEIAFTYNKRILELCVIRTF